MNALRRMAIIFAASLVVAKLVDVFLRSASGRQMVRGVGLNSLLTTEGVEAAKRYSKTATGLLVGTALTLRAHKTDRDLDHDSNLVQTAQSAAELVMAAGALAKIVSDFLREEQEIRKTRMAL